MNKVLLDLYSDYLLSSFSLATATDHVGDDNCRPSDIVQSSNINNRTIFKTSCTKCDERSKLRKTTRKDSLCKQLNQGNWSIYCHYSYFFRLLTGMHQIHKLYARCSDGSVVKISGTMSRRLSGCDFSNDGSDGLTDNAYSPPDHPLF
jgi:hypothetical protein